MLTVKVNYILRHKWLKQIYKETLMIKMFILSLGILIRITKIVKMQNIDLRIVNKRQIVMY